MKSSLSLVLVALCLSVTPADADPSFYAGKTIRIVVGSSAGGGFDIYSRAIARHLGRHIPGTPLVIVENMPGAGSLVAANHLYRIAKPDGLTFGVFAGALVLGQILGQPGIEFDGRRFAWLGMPARDPAVCAVTRASGVTTVDTWMAAKRPIKIGGMGTSGSLDNVPRVLAATLGLPIQLVVGYKGTADVRLAAESGEVAGGCWTWDSMRSMWRDQLASGEVIPLVQLASRPLRDLPNVPLAVNLARTDEARQLLDAVMISAELSRTYALPPATPADRVQLLRAAFAETLRDPDYVREVNRLKLESDPVTGEELTRLVESLFGLPPAITARLRDILK